MKMKLFAVVGVVFAVATARAQIQTAGDLLVNVDVSSLSALPDGAKVSSWVNSGTLGGDFTPAISGQGAVYQASVDGNPAVTFAGSANSVMTSAIVPPASILSNNTWSVELWVLNPTLENPEDQLVWTDRGDWPVVRDGTCMEFRYCSDGGNAVEHYSSANIPWSGSPPQANLWHHLAITRAADGTERLYADGILRTTKVVALNLRSGSTFKLGGVYDLAAKNWQMPFSGSLAKVRVHDGTLSGAQVINNFRFERGAYQAFWTGTPGLSLPWNDPANWSDGNVGVDGDAVWVDNGGTAVITNDLALAYLYPNHGGLTITQGAALTFSKEAESRLGDGAGNNFHLMIPHGSFTVGGSSQINLLSGVNGGQGDVIVGGTGEPALLAVGRDFISASGNGSVGNCTVLSGGGIFCHHGWFYAAEGLGAQGSVLVDGGTIGFDLPDRSFIVNANGARANVVVDDGIIDSTGDIIWSVGTATNRSYGAVYLNGGMLRAKSLYAASTVGTNLLYLNGGTIQPRESRVNFLQNLTAAYLQSGGVTFDIPAAIQVIAQQPLIEDPTSLGGALIKTGTGRLTLNGVNTMAGDIEIQAGDLFLSNTNGLPANYMGVISVANEGAIGYAKVNGPSQLLGRLSPVSSGYLTLFQNNAADAVDFSAFPNMKLALNGVTAYTGAFTPYRGQYDYLVEGHMVENSTVLTNAASYPGHLSITGAAGGGMILSADNTFTGGVLIDSAVVSLAHVNGLGIQGSPGVPDVELRSGGTLRLDVAMDVNAVVVSRLLPSSNGILLIGAANASQNIDLTGLPGIVVGSAENTLDYSGVLTPAGNTYRLGGGNTIYRGQPHRGLSLNNLADQGGATKVVIGTPGIVELKASNTYSGGTVVSNRGVLFLKEDALGAIPAAFDPDNISVDGGVLRSGPAQFTVHANRGVAVGSGGMELHPWGDSNMTIAGNLSGSGDITTTDRGFVTFAGAANTYDGELTIGGERNIRIGDGPNYSWIASTIRNDGSLWLKSDNPLLFSTVVSGSGALHKEGSGTLTIDAQQNYTGITHVDAGVLQVSDTDILPVGADLQIAVGAQLDVNGLDLALGSLRGAGAVIDSAGSAASLTLGAANKSGVFDGTVASPLSLIKTGSGQQSLTAVNGAAQANVQQGTLELLKGGTVAGAVTVANQATLSVAANDAGLRGKFYKLASAPLPADFVSLAAMDAFLSAKTPDLILNSTSLGAGLDMGSTANPSSNKFPAGYNQNGNENFVVYWSGSFYAATSGTYGFATVSDDGSLIFIDGAVVCDHNSYRSYNPADANPPSWVTLERGYHEIVAVMYEATGDQGFTAYLTPPGGVQSVLPNALLFSGAADHHDSSVGSLAGVTGSTLRFSGVGQPVLHVTADGDMLFSGDIISTNDFSRLVKEGSGQLTLSSGTSDQHGTLDIRQGSLLLPGGTATLGVLEMSAGVITEITSFNGLVMEFYNRIAADPDYSEMQSLEGWKSYLQSTFPGGPSYVTNTLMLGANLDSGRDGSKWPDPYKQATGSQKDNYDTYIYGDIYLDRTGSYTFGTGSDDGSMLYVNGQLVVNNGFDQGVVVRSGTVALNAGFHRLDILYRENGGGNALEVHIQYPGESDKLMPQAILFSGAALRGLAGDAGSTLGLGSDGILLLNQEFDTLHAGTLLGDSSAFIQKTGAGTLTLTDDNAGFDAGYGIVNGTLRVGDGGTTGALGPTASVFIGTTGTLVFDRAGTVIVGGPLTGTGLIQVNGPGEVYVTANGAFDGLVEVNDGRLTFAPGISLSKDSTITNLAVVEVETTGINTFYGDLVGNSGTFLVTGDGTLQLKSDSIYSGTTRIDAGATLQVSKTAQLGGGGDVVLAGGTLAVSPSFFQRGDEIIPTLANPGWTVNGSATRVTRSDNPWVELTPNLDSRAGTVFNNTKMNPGQSWYLSLRYEVGAAGSNPADGMAFVLQNDNRGISALGPSGGAIGVEGINPSVGFFFNLYNTDSIGWIVDGAKSGGNTQIEGINLVDGVDIELLYDGARLMLTVTQGVKVYTAEKMIDLNAKFGGQSVWAGMTGGTGGATAQQFVGEFLMTSAVATAMEFSNTLVVQDSGTGSLTPKILNGDTAVNFGGMTLGAGATLSVAAAQGSQLNIDYLVGVSNLVVATGNATVAVAANGTGTGVLGLENLSIGSGALLTVTGGVSAPAGTLTVVVPTPVPKGVTLLGDFTAATWVGGQPVLALVDESGDPIDALLVLRNGKLYINTLVGTVLIVR